MTHAHTTRTIAGLGIVLATLLAPAVDTAPSDFGSTPAKPVPVIEVVEVAEPVIFAFPEDEAAYANVLAAFTGAGFDAPTFLTRFHATADACKGYYGLHVKTADGTSTVNVCRTHERASFQQMARERTLMHEAAHVWVDQNVSDTQLAAFMELRGLSVWEGNAAEWSQLGAEHAAEILLWGMTDESRNINFSIPQDDTEELRTAYRILIGA